jgi:hypothetical protein
MTFFSGRRQRQSKQLFHDAYSFAVDEALNAALERAREE